MGAIKRVERTGEHIISVFYKSRVWLKLLELQRTEEKLVYL